MNRIQNVLKEKDNLLSIYFTAGFPQLHDTATIIQEIEKAGADMIEIGLPFSDPLADGPTIQESGAIALQNGMTTQVLFEQLRDIRKTVSIPLIIMGYFNPMLQYGMEAFCEKCEAIGIDGLIIPDLPLSEYKTQYQSIFKKHNLQLSFLITPQTSTERVNQIDNASDSFIYMVSSASVTGSISDFGEAQTTYFKKIEAMDLKNPQIVGFGIKDAATFTAATAHAKGAIIGSAFIRMLKNEGVAGISKFIRSIKLV